MTQGNFKWLFTIREVAKLFGVGTYSARRWMHEGKFEASFIGGKYYVTIWDLFNFLDERKRRKSSSVGNPNFAKS